MFACLTCSKEFTPNRVRNPRTPNEAKFCSRKCFHIYRRSYQTVTNVSCANCGKEIYRNASQQANSKSGLFFCSMKCKASAQTIGGIKEIMPSHYGMAVSAYTYREKLLRSTTNKKCALCGYANIVEILHVHHIDCNRSNNELDNLQLVCPNCHEELHFKDRSGKWAMKQVGPGNSEIPPSSV